MTSQIWWYATRGAGLMAWAVACASVIVGLLTSTRLLGVKPSKPWLVDLHRQMSGLTLAFIGLHLVTLWLDDFVEFTLVELFVPFTDDWKRFPVAWGVIAMWLLIAVEISSLVKDRIPHRWWITIHLTSYPTVLLGTLHAWQSGTDVGTPLVWMLGLVMLGLVLSLSVVRVLVLREGGPTERAVDRRKEMLAKAKGGGRRSVPRGGRRSDDPNAGSLAGRWVEAEESGSQGDVSRF